VVADLPRPVQQLMLDDDPDLLTYRITSARH